MCKCCCNGTGNADIDEKQIQLTQRIETLRQEPGALIPLLQEAQDIYGYLSRDVMHMIARGLKIPIAQVYGAATFYSQFRFVPTGRHVIKVCMGTACHVRGALKVLRSLERELNIQSGQTTEDGKFTLETVACIGACGLAPVIAINNRVFGNLTAQMVPEILAKFE